jgi:RNA-directed DNA polymerase
VILVNSHPRQQWLRQAVEKRLREELAKLQVEVNEDKSRKVDLQQGESFGFLGFLFRRIRSRRGRWMPRLLPKGKKRTALLDKLRTIFRKSRSQPISGVIDQINPILRGWVQYLAIGHSSVCFSYIRNWVETKIRRHLARACQRRGLEAGNDGPGNGCTERWDFLPSTALPISSYSRQSPRSNRSHKP